MQSISPKSSFKKPHNMGVLCEYKLDLFPAITVVLYAMLCYIFTTLQQHLTVFDFNFW